jgi:tRNA pseudouridine55 synthase
MPKDTPPPRPPISGVFAVAKPSRPTRMAVINNRKNLINTASLFVEQEELVVHKEGKNEKPKRRKCKWKSNGDMVKVGQGGVLDSLTGGFAELRLLFS